MKNTLKECIDGKINSHIPQNEGMLHSLKRDEDIKNKQSKKE